MNEQSRSAPGKRSLGGHDGELVRVAAVHEERSDAEETFEQLRRHGIAGHELDLIAGEIGVEHLISPLSERRYDLVHLCSPGPTASTALTRARALRIPTTAAFGPEPAQGDAIAAFYGACELVLSNSRTADAALRTLGVCGERIHHWTPGVDLECFSPARYHPEAMPSIDGTLALASVDGARTIRINVLYTGELDAERGVPLLADAFLRAREHDPRLHLILAGDGPAEPDLRERLGAAASFLGELDREQLARVYASADLLVFPDATATFGRSILEAQASGLPVLAVDAGGGAELIQSGRSGCLASPSAPSLAAAIYGLARRPPLRERLATGGLAAVREHSWERALDRLAEVWEAARMPSRETALELPSLHEAAHAA